MPKMKALSIPESLPKRERERRFLLTHIEDLMFGCVCQHLDSGHVLCEGKCDYDNCNCQKFTPEQFKITCAITVGDLFESENPNHSEKDSTAYWNEFFSWKLRRRT